MTNYTAADALELAERLKLQAQRESSAVLSDSECSFVAKMAEFWAKHEDFFKPGDILVFDNTDWPNAPSRLHLHQETEELQRICFVRDQVGKGLNFSKFAVATDFYYLRKATPEEEAAGHRIDEVKNA